MLRRFSKPFARLVDQLNRLPHLTLWGGLLLAVSGLVSVANTYSSLPRIYAEWHFWLPLIQLSGLAVLLRFGAFPTTRSGWFLAAGIHCLVVGVVFLFFQHQFEYAVLEFAHLVLRLGVVALWVAPAIGIPLFVRWLCVRQSGQCIKFQHGKWLLFAIVLLATLEPAMYAVEWASTRLKFPNRLDDPAENELRIVTLGGSTMVGYPYQPKFGISKMLELELQRKYPTKNVVIENLARPGLNLRNAISQLNTLRIRPHLLVLYSGHNEYLQDLEELSQSTESPFAFADVLFRRSPTFRMMNSRLSKRMDLRAWESNYSRELLDKHIASPSVRKSRVARFADRLNQLANFCHREKIATTWYVPAGSESVYEPNRSYVSKWLTEIERVQLALAVEQTTRHQTQGEWKKAAQSARAGLNHFPEVAELHFQLGECLEKVQQFAAAQRHYSASLDLDGHPVRCTREYRTAIAEVARNHHISAIHAANILRTHAENGILDRTLFHDNVHPTLLGHYLLGQAAVEAIENSQLLESVCGTPRISFPHTLESAVAESGLNEADFANGYKMMSATLGWLGRLRFDDTRRLREAEQYANVSRWLVDNKVWDKRITVSDDLSRQEYKQTDAPGSVNWRSTRNSQIAKRVSVVNLGNGRLSAISEPVRKSSGQFSPIAFEQAFLKNLQHEWDSTEPSILSANRE